MNESDLDYMKLAIKLAAMSVNEDDKKPHPKVGAVVVTKEGEVIEAYRGMLDKGDHAEFIALEKVARDRKLSDATLYTTLEPCTTRKHSSKYSSAKVPCVYRILDNDIKKVWIGMLDPNPDIYAKSLYILERNGKDVEFFPKYLRDEIKEINKEFIKSFEPGTHLTKAYWSVGTVENVSSWSKGSMSSSLWSGISNSKLQEVGECVSELEEIKRFFPIYTDMSRSLRFALEEDTPAVVTGITIRTTFLIKNTSGNPEVMTLSVSEGNLPHQKSDHFIIEYRTSFDNQNIISIEPYGHVQATAIVSLYASQVGSEFEPCLRISQKFVESIRSGIHGLTFVGYMQDGTDLRREFGIRIRGNHEEISKVERIPAAEILKNWMKVKEASDRLVAKKEE